MKIVIAASEVVPFAKTGGLADVTGALPIALEKQGQDVIVVMPKYKCVSAGNLKPVIGGKSRVYFIENQRYFNRDGLYGDKAGDYEDNLQRFSYFCKEALELLKQINFKPDIIHLHDWQTALIPLYLKAKYSHDAFYKDTKTILTVHNIGYQGLFAKEEFAQLDLDKSYFGIEGLEFYGKVNLLKGGLLFSDKLNTVSPTYSREIQTKEFGFGLEGVLHKRRAELSGILNGLDYSLWSPEGDGLIKAKYRADNLKDKYADKEDLQKLCGFAKNKEAPLLGIVSRLAEQKGFDILGKCLPDICRMGLQFVILGAGDLKYHRLLQRAAKKYPKNISLHLKFDNALAHRIYAGADIFLMPSRYEPCGLGQMISLRYGTLPLVFRTGGLADTVNKDNGFIFDRYSKDGLLGAIKEAVRVFQDRDKWLKMMKCGMKCDFSWDETAKKYLELYAEAKK